MHGDHEEMVAIDRVSIGTVMIVRPGEKIPLDGSVVTGRSDVNQAPITGESLPADKGPGDEVFAGTINGHGALEVAVTRKGRDTTLARIIHLVEEAQAQRAPSQQFIDRFARWYTPAVIILAILVAVVPPLLGGVFDVWFYRALVLLVVSCPCALVISTPVSVVSALAGAARRGVLIKGGVHLERLAAIRTIAFDKTGTLTRGKLRVTAVRPAHGTTESALHGSRGRSGGALGTSGGSGDCRRSISAPSLRRTRGGCAGAPRSRRRRCRQRRAGDVRERAVVHGAAPAHAGSG